MEAVDDVDIDGATKIQRACDSCRARKIRCDRGSPCSNCKASKLTCQTTAPTQKIQRQRVHISDEYEKKIDRIEDRLASIESVLEKLATKLADLDIHKDHSDPSSHSRTSRLGRSPNDAHTPAPFEGETTLNSQSDFARELLEHAVESTPSIGQNAEIKAALTSLQAMVSRQNRHSLTKNEPQPLLHRALANIDASKLERPPWEAVTDVLDKASTNPTMSFAVIFPFLQISNVRHIFQDAFSTPESCSSARRVLVYGTLYNLFTEFACYPVLGQQVDSFRQYAALCRTQLETAMSQLDLIIPPSYENILALLLAASYAIELCKPSLCWIFTSTVIGLCQSLGYHRISSMKEDTAEERAAKINVFWFIYLMDKTLSLRLGRASAIQDWDISLPYPTPDDVSSQLPSIPKGAEMQLYWIKVAQVQGQTYERLFSPAAFTKSHEERSKVAAELVKALDDAWAVRGEAELTFPGSLGDIGDLFYHADIVMHYATMTLIQRATSPDDITFTQDCLVSARAALVAHQRCSQQFNVAGNEDLWSGYVHWSVLQSPFTPFIVIFCNAIIHCDPTDLSHLSDFVLSLESCRTLSEGADKLYKMCHLFLQVAKLYVEAKTKETSESATANPEGFYPTGDGQQNLDPSAMTQFDPYLSALGLMPNSAWPLSAYTPFGQGMEFQGIQGAGAGSTGGGGSGGNRNTVQDWFSGSRYIMGLLEDDINMPDTSFG